LTPVRQGTARALLLRAEGATSGKPAQGHGIVPRASRAAQVRQPVQRCWRFGSAAFQGSTRPTGAKPQRPIATAVLPSEATSLNLSLHSRSRSSGRRDDEKLRTDHNFAFLRRPPQTFLPFPIPKHPTVPFLPFVRFTLTESSQAKLLRKGSQNRIAQAPRDQDTGPPGLIFSLLPAAMQSAGTVVHHFPRLALL
jgi:hypothetical protein